MTILVLGAGGLLGGAFAKLIGDTVEVAGRQHLQEDLYELIRRAGAVAVINCAADTDVEGAEREPASSHRANVVLPGALAQACRRAGALLAHISSTGCYGVRETRPYIETDPPEPTTVHHRHKLEGESRVRASGCQALILRTGWLFGGRPGHDRNFVWNRMVEASGKPRLTSDPFQIGNPTFVDDVARQTMVLLERGLTGTFNCVGMPPASRLDYVRTIVAAAGMPCEVVGADAPFRRLARVSPNEAAEPKRLRDLRCYAMPPWPVALSRYVATLVETEAWREVTAAGGRRS